ncbi:MAG: elongation factor Ts [Alphaproteobacteria bacterium]|nr:elongation factor Ts [Alphaproteobacteria bacterium]
MTEVTAQMVKELREQTGAGMLDCKKALAENGGDHEAAKDWLRKKGLSAAAKKSGRVAAEGLVAVYAAGTEGAAIELNSETDFVARNPDFQKVAGEVAKLAPVAKGDVEKLKTASYPGTGRNVADEIANLVGVIGENMNLRRTAYLQVSQGVVASYIHNAVVPGAGKIGVLVALESAAPVDKLQAFGKQLAMHVAAARPEALTSADVDGKNLEREKQIFREQALASGKPENIVDKMVEGRVRKYYEEVVLLEQVYVVDGKSKVSDLIANAGKELGAPVKLTGFIRYGLGEGIEKQESDFAAEVAAAAGTAAA